MFDLKWIVEEQLSAMYNGGCPYAAIRGMASGLALSEADTIVQYNNMADGVMKVKAKYANDEKLCKLCDIVNGMIMQIVQDEGDHNMSATKISAVIGNYKPPKPEEYDAAVKEEGKYE